jgi:hypothetical protein
VTGRRSLILPGVALVLMLIVAVAWGIPFLNKARPDRTSTPTPPPFSTIAPIVLKPGQQACESLVALSPDTRTVTVLSAQFDGTGPRLQVEATAPGYRGTGEIAAGYGGLTSLPASIPAPPRNAIGQVCVRNTGTKATQLQGTTEGRIQNRNVTSVDGEQIPEKLSLLLSEATDRSIADRPGQILDRISAFKPPIVDSVSLSIFLVLLLIGAPLGVLYAIWRGISADEPETD